MAWAFVTGVDSAAATKLKPAVAPHTALKSTTSWSNNGNGSDDFGFSALPGGVRYYDSGGFSNAGNSGSWWSSSLNGGDAWRRALGSGSPDIARYDNDARYGFSVRCLRDAV